MERNRVEELITTYSCDMLPLWADPFSRWPVGQAAREIAVSLHAAGTYWRDMGFAEIAQELDFAAVEITNRAEY